MWGRRILLRRLLLAALPRGEDLAIQWNVLAEPSLLGFGESRAPLLDELHGPAEVLDARLAVEYFKDEKMMPEDALGLHVGVANLGEQPKGLIGRGDGAISVALLRAGKGEVGEGVDQLKALTGPKVNAVRSLQVGNGL